MSRRFLITRIPTVNEEEADKLEAQLGRRPTEKDIDYSYAETVIDLLEVSAIRESYNDSELVEEEAVVYLYGEPYFIQTPYKEVRDQWLALMDGEPEASAPIDLGQAINTLAKALREDPELYFGYQSNIAMAFTDVWNAYAAPIANPVLMPKRDLINQLSNQAAKNFLDSLIKSLE